MSAAIYILFNLLVLTVPIYIIRKLIETAGDLFNKIIDKHAERTAYHIIKKIKNTK